MEVIGELSEGTGTENNHYTQGGQPGKFQPLNGIFEGMSAERKEMGLVTEINNGRLAQLGIFGFLCAQTIPGSVPALTGIVKPYAGEVMAPFS